LKSKYRERGKCEAKMDINFNIYDRKQKGQLLITLILKLFGLFVCR